jgi:hypothetical protein
MCSHAFQEQRSGALAIADIYCPSGCTAGVFVTLHVIEGWTQREDGLLHGFGRDVN